MTEVSPPPQSRRWRSSSRPIRRGPESISTRATSRRMVTPRSRCAFPTPPASISKRRLRARTARRRRRIGTACFDGEQTELDLRQDLVRATGEIQVGELEKHLVGSLSSAGFLEDEVFERLRQEKLKEFADAPKREASHAGSAYPDEPEEARV